MLVAMQRAVLAGTLLFMAACGGGEEPVEPGSVQLSTETDIAYGDPDAPLTLIKYASLTCGACANFNNSVLSEIKPEYVETGKLRVVTREVLGAPREIDMAGYSIARCAGPDNYAAVVDDIFTNFNGVMSAVRAGAGRQVLQSIAARHGLDEQAFEACLSNPDIQDEVMSVHNLAFETVANERGQVPTPKLYLNGVELDSPEARTAEGLSAILDAELAKGE